MMLDARTKKNKFYRPVKSSPSHVISLVMLQRAGFYVESHALNLKL